MATQHGMDDTLAAEPDDTEDEQPDDPDEPDVPDVPSTRTDTPRYEIIGLLGRGGMGEVYEARDHRLGRAVAIKTLTSTNPNDSLRLVREARAQARIEHPNVCRVYEVDERDGRPYLVLQLVRGMSLQLAARTMSLADKVATIRDVANGVHEAHRQGIVHRDLKPSNIMIETSESGRGTPVVMDFGLARESAHELGLTRSGAVLGTPVYMSPEQARGDVRVVDKRSDVYSLGATLYELLTGHPPFASASLAELLHQIIHDEPRRPRKLVIDLPADLETIVLTCLAKNPHQRYLSARALAEDLSRFLDGEPLVARPPSAWRQLRASIRRHRAVAAVAAASLVALATVTAIAAHNWRVGQRTQELTRHLDQQAAEVEALVHSAAQLPLQDFRPARSAALARMQSIAATSHDLGAGGDAIVHGALGRAHLALHDWRAAADELALADLGTTSLHAARGRALVELYRESVDEARRSGDPNWFAHERNALERAYLRPAVAELVASKQSGSDTVLIDARIALARGDGAESEQLAARAAVATPWLTEAIKLAGDAAYQVGLGAFDHGRYDDARADLGRAAAYYLAARDDMRSDASIYEAEAQVWLEIAEIDARQARPARDSLDRALVATNKALLTDADDVTALTVKSYILLRWVRVATTGDDPRALLATAEQAASQAVELDLFHGRAWDALADVDIARGIYANAHGDSGEQSWSRAVDELAVAELWSPGDPWVANDLGVAQRWLGDALDDRGSDPTLHYQAALASYERATTLDPNFVYAWANQIDLYASLAERETRAGRDPRTVVARAGQSAQHCLAVDPSFDGAAHNLARARLALAEYELDSGSDPSPTLVSIHELLAGETARHTPTFGALYYSLVAARLEVAVAARDGADPTTPLSDARQALAAVLQIRASSPEGHVEAARIELLDASSTTSIPKRTAAARRAIASAEQAVSLDGQLVDARVVAAQAYLAMAAISHERETISRGLSHVDRALKLDPGQATARATRAALAAL